MTAARVADPRALSPNPTTRASADHKSDAAGGPEWAPAAAKSRNEEGFSPLGRRGSVAHLPQGLQTEERRFVGFSFILVVLVLTREGFGQQLLEQAQQVMTEAFR